jgi:hypothetical protein
MSLALSITNQLHRRVWRRLVRVWRGIDRSMRSGSLAVLPRLSRNGADSLSADQFKRILPWIELAHTLGVDVRLRRSKQRRSTLASIDVTNGHLGGYGNYSGSFILPKWRRNLPSSDVRDNQESRYLAYNSSRVSGPCKPKPKPRQPKPITLTPNEQAERTCLALLARFARALCGAPSRQAEARLFAFGVG